MAGQNLEFSFIQSYTLVLTMREKKQKLKYPFSLQYFTKIC